MRRIVAVVLQLLLIGCGQRHGLPQSTPILAFTHVNIVDVVTGTVARDQTLVIAGSRIQTVGASTAVRLPAGVQVVEADGSYVIPGLWDMHVHVPGRGAFEGLAGTEFLQVYVARGVTGIRDMGADCADTVCARWMRLRGDIERLKYDIAAARLIGPRIISPGPVVDGPVPVHQGSLIVPHADSARTIVRAQVARGTPFIKVYDRLSRDAYFALAAESRKLGIPFAGHVPASVSPAEASAAGQRSLEHLWLVLDGCSNIADELLARRRARVSAAIRRDTTFPFAADNYDLNRRTLETFDPAICRDLAGRFRRNGTWMVPTNAGTWGSAMAGDTNFSRRAEAASVPRWLQNALAQFADQSSRSTSQEIEQRRQWHRRKLDVVGLMHGAGVQFLAGTDNPGAHTYPGYSLHDELALLVEAGLSPLQALQAATLNPATFLSATDSLGQVSPGKIADLVLLDANPLQNIENIRRIRAVVLAGRFLDRAALQQLLRGDLKKRLQ